LCTLLQGAGQNAGVPLQVAQLFFGFGFPGTSEQISHMCHIFAFSPGKPIMVCAWQRAYKSRVSRLSVSALLLAALIILPIYKDKLNLWYDIALSNIEDNVYLSLPLLVEVYPRIFSRSLGNISSWHLSFLLSIKSDARRAYGMVLALSKTPKLSYMMAFTVLSGDRAPVLLSWQRSVIYHFLFGMPASSMSLEPVDTVFGTSVTLRGISLSSLSR
jgi:hypothetical protein